MGLLACPWEVEAVPPHVGDGQTPGDHCADVPHLPLNEAQTGVLPVLKGLFKQQLHPQADAQDGFARGRLVEDRLEHPRVPQLLHRVAEGPTPGRMMWSARSRTLSSRVTTASSPMAPRELFRENRLPTP